MCFTVFTIFLFKFLKWGGGEEEHGKEGVGKKQENEKENNPKMKKKYDNEWLNNQYY